MRLGLLPHKAVDLFEHREKRSERFQRQGVGSIAERVFRVRVNLHEDPIGAGSDSQAELGIPIVTSEVAPSPQTFPQDILEEVAFYEPEARTKPSCDAETQTPSLIWPPNEQRDAPLELGWGRLAATTCGWQANESVYVVLKLPDDSSRAADIRAITQTERTGDGYVIGVTYDTSLDDPPGHYVITFDEYGRSIEYSRDILLPSGPRLLWDWDDGAKTNSQLLLYNFAPDERVRLIAYGRTPEHGCR